MGESSKAIDALRQCRPNTRVTVTNGGQRFGVTVDASAIVRDFDAMAEDRNHWKAEAEKWQRIALALSDGVVA